MTREIMVEWLANFDRRMKREKRRILLFLDNAASHADIQLSNIKIVFLPPNITAACQPLDQGIIKNLKVFYRQLSLKRLLCSIDSASSLSELEKSITVLHALTWIKCAWGKVTKETISHCFSKAGFNNT